MEERKLIRLGNSSFAIALPKEWVTKSKLNKGDKVFLERNGNGEIIVSPEFKKSGNNKEITIDVKGKEEEEIAREVISAYICGNKKIIFKGEKREIKTVKNVSKKFLNLELIDEKEGFAIFEDLLDLEQIDIKNFIKRIDNNIKEMFEILSEILNSEKNQKKRIKELYEIDEDITKFYFLIWRFMRIGIDNPSIQSSLKISPNSFFDYFWVSYNIEQIGDEIKTIAKKINKENRECVKNIFSIIVENYHKLMKSFFENKKNFSKEIILEKEKMIERFNKLSDIQSSGAIVEKFQQININIHNVAKMVFYEF
ncbi:MAG: phosphate uptake regulator PhoU [Nanoarchaeota archaeon]|nr:phosphate uptake regulator PhoU [Nanoarchaeota archaeon]